MYFFLVCLLSQLIWAKSINISRDFIEVSKGTLSQCSDIQSFSSSQTFAVVRHSRNSNPDQIHIFVISCPIELTVFIPWKKFSNKYDESISGV